MRGKVVAQVGGTVAETDEGVTREDADAIQPGTVMALVAMGLGVFVIANDFTALNVALPAIEQDFNVDVGTAQWVINGYALVFGVLIVTGGNIDVNIVSRIIDRGLVGDGRLARLMVKVRDRPGQLAHLTERVASKGANVLEIAHRRAFADISVGDVEIVMHLETRGREHVEEIIALLAEDGLTVEEDA